MEWYLDVVKEWAVVFNKYFQINTSQLEQSKLLVVLNIMLPFYKMTEWLLGGMPLT